MVFLQDKDLINFTTKTYQARVSVNIMTKGTFFLESCHHITENTGNKIDMAGAGQRSITAFARVRTTGSNTSERLQQKVHNHLRKEESQKM